jgi:hypothetical protein
MTSKRSRKKITPEILELYRRARALHDQGGLESDVRYAYIDANSALDLALGRAPYDIDIFDALDEYRDTEITPEMILATRGRPVVAQWGPRKAARDLGLDLERMDHEDLIMRMVSR